MSQSPDFTTMAYGVNFAKPSFADWKASVEKASGKTLEQLVSATMEQIDVYKRQHEYLPRGENNYIEMYVL